MSSLKLDGVVAGYGQGDILRGVNLEVEAGSVMCVIGPNGAGKSTILRAVSGLLRPRLGSIAVDGQPIASLKPREVLTRGIVHVPQERSLFPQMTVWENVLLGAHVLGDRAQARRRIEEVAERFPILRERRHDHAGSLSGGEQKTVELARALMLDPKLIMLDEPSMGLDPKARQRVFTTVRGLNETGLTVLLVEQNARAGLEIADEGAVMDGGVVKLRARGRDLLDDPRVGALYLGAPLTPREAAPEPTR
ncbi:MAG TPA: ABC transporter ATP-binding protein [Thermoleophilaceae bacterium]|nr:ABC transporter ATP-binding protein [Thermoleophilaceae bacterium]